MSYFVLSLNDLFTHLDLLTNCEYVVIQLHCNTLERQQQTVCCPSQQKLVVVELCSDSLKLNNQSEFTLLLTGTSDDSVGTIIEKQLMTDVD